MEIFSKEYLDYLDKLDKVQEQIKVNPNVESYKEYALLKNKSWNPKQRFSKYYLEQFKREKAKGNLSFEDQCEWLYNSLMIDVKHERNQYTDNQRLLAHRDNDLKYNM